MEGGAWTVASDLSHAFCSLWGFPRNAAGQFVNAKRSGFIKVVSQLQVVGVCRVQ